MARKQAFLIMCMDDFKYYLATRQIFFSREAAEDYAVTIAASRQPVIIDLYQLIESMSASLHTKNYLTDREYGDQG